jgi:hypothetical protein
MAGSTKLACQKCGSRNTVVMDRSDLAKATGDASVMSSASGMVPMSPDIIIAIIKFAIAAITAIGTWFVTRENNRDEVVVCKDCGHWVHA